MANEVHVVEKQVTEQRTLTWDGSAQLPTGVSVLSGTITAVDEDGDDASSLFNPTISVSSQSAIFVLLKDVGVAGKDYRLSLLLVLDNADTWEAEYLVKVRNY